MLIRPYAESDFEAVKALHKTQGFAYELPDLTKMLVSAVIQENGEVTHAIFLRQTSEAYWIFNTKQNKRERLGRLLALSKELLGPAQRAGIQDVHAFLPPEIVTPSLHRTFLRLGWKKPLWTCYVKEVG